MQPTDYPLGARARQAALGMTTRQPMTLTEFAVAQNKLKAPRASSPMAMPPADIYKPYEYPAAVYPDGIAMDSCLPAPQQGISNWATNSYFHEAQGFFGFPYLAELIQRAEYRHACEIWAEHSVRKWIKFIGGKDAERTAIETEFTRLNVRDVFQEWAMNDHNFGRGQIFLDFDDADDEAELRVPLLLTDRKISPKRPLQRLNIVQPMWSAPGMYSTLNPLRHDFYEPQSWFVYGKIVAQNRLLTITSRPVADMLKPAYAFGGQSLVQLMKPYVDNWLRTRQAVSDMINRFSIVSLKTDMSSILGGGTGDSLYLRAELFTQMADNRGLFLLDTGNAEELDSIAVPLSGLDALQAQAQEQMASVARIPLSIYLQITPTGLNATSDGETRNFYADVKAYQEKNFRPALQRILEIVQLSLGQKVNPDIKFEFIDLWEMSDKDKADIRKSDAEADIGYVQTGIVSADEARERLSEDETSLYHGVDLTDPAPELPEATGPGDGSTEDTEDSAVNDG